MIAKTTTAANAALLKPSRNSQSRMFTRLFITASDSEESEGPLKFVRDVARRAFRNSQASSKPAEQHENQNNDEYEAKPAASVIAGAVEWATAKTTEASE
jgi:hypothetical protein